MGVGDDLVGATLLGKLRVVHRLGAGGLGSVYEVEHVATHNRHALKVLHARHAMNADAVSRLVREAGVAARVRSRRLVTTLDVGQLDDGRAYLLMELLEGRTWRDLLRARGSLHPSEAIRLALQVCEGLAAAHAAGVVHRDLKPDNVFLVPGPAGEEVKLLDFGVAKNLPGHTDRFGALTGGGAMLGTPLYLSPEQGMACDDIDGRADQYALAVMLYESLTGRVPFEASQLAELIALIHEGGFRPIREHAPHVPSELAAVVERAMSRERDARYGSVKTFAAALAPFASRPTPTGAPERSPPVSSTADTLAAAVAPSSPPPVGATAPTLAAARAGAVDAFAPTIDAPVRRPAPAATRARRPWIAVLSALLATLVAAGAGGIVWRVARRPITRRGPARSTAPAATPTAPPASEGDPLPGISPAMQAVARAQPASLPGMQRSRPITEDTHDGVSCIATYWTGLSPGPRVSIAICDGFGVNPYTRLSHRPAYDDGRSFMRAVETAGHPAWHEWTARTGQAQVQVEIADRYWLIVVTEGQGAGLSLWYAEQVDLEALRRLAPSR